MTKHCYDYIDDQAQPECLRRFLDYHCRPAALKYPTGREDFDRGLEERLGMPMWRDPVPVLFARHEGRPVRVTMASRFGDVGITEHLDAERGYDKRVAVEDLTDFSDAALEPRATVHVPVDWNAPTWAPRKHGQHRRARRREAPPRRPCPVRGVRAPSGQPGATPGGRGAGEEVLTCQAGTAARSRTTGT
ncbi:hypothetical protein [Methylobacterium pseudosasicola]|uniref:Uncharacterized protein n=1 Tax=Methylobacterium pseudosasicola TaxID=582667 RepID=A0A1I4N0I2_9HYPH|nr:hypothetical protein [Methylobacterium pseudosasicola]SFM08988.1 hypothetical protein SAMN05192568_10195 [Methylobacterium pseudosasicola]